MAQVTREANKRVSKQVSEYTTNLRSKLETAGDFSEEFERVFGDFADKKLGKDELFYSIKNEIDAKAK